MRLALLTSLTMLAFASNSVLTRMAIEGGHIDPSAFAIVRVASGALVLGMLIGLRGGAVHLLRRNRLPGAFSLTVYMIGFSLAYLSLDAGLGALILFGVVQITMFVHGMFVGNTPSVRQLTGAGLAFFGLLLALWPGPGGVADPIGAVLMVFAGVGWAAYTIIGRGSSDPLGATAANFILCLPMMFVLLLFGVALSMSFQGILLGILCGGLTSGLGYALWYRVLPGLDTNTAAVVQLSVPIIAILAGVILLGEPLGVLLILVCALVVGGIAWALSAQSAPTGRK